MLNDIPVSFVAIVNAMEAKDVFTKGHSGRVAEYAVTIGKTFPLNPTELRVLKIAALLHDIGKIGVPDFILMKPASLSKYEYEIIKEHTIKGFLIMRPYIKTLPDLVASIIFHHETFNGNGYPLHLLKDEIPLFPRIISVADAFDAMTSDRPYRKGLPIDEAIRRLKNGEGTQFDPDIVRRFLYVLDKGYIKIGGS